MVSLSTVQASNAAIPPYTTPLVAVFVGATSGIGKASLLQFVRHTAATQKNNKLRIYFVGRSQTAADGILEQLRRIKPESESDGDGDGGAEYTFIQADVSLLRQVDEVCKQIREKESMINLLFLSQGTLDMTTGMKYYYVYVYACMYCTDDSRNLGKTIAYPRPVVLFAHALYCQSATPPPNRCHSSIINNQSRHLRHGRHKRRPHQRLRHCRKARHAVEGPRPFVFHDDLDHGAFRREHR